jgi:hypothetical protein
MLEVRKGWLPKAMEKYGILKEGCAPINKDVYKLLEIIVKLQARLSEKGSCRGDINEDILHRAIKAEQALAPTKKSLEVLTAERSKWQRKIKRLENKR